MRHIAIMQSLYWARVPGMVPDRCTEVQVNEAGDEIPIVHVSGVPADRRGSGPSTALVELK